MKKILITKSGKMHFISGSQAAGTTLEIQGDENQQSVDASSVGKEDWEKIRKSKDPKKDFDRLIPKGKGKPVR